MIRYVFMDNYRGFAETLIPLREANFLVGENSTGKSSVLSLVFLLSDPKFWFDQDFGSRHVSTLGGFGDIVSVGSPNKSTFTVGTLMTRKVASGPDPKRECRFVLMTFGDEEGVPRLRRYVQLEGGALSTIVFGRKGVSYKITYPPVQGRDEKSVCEWFKRLYRRLPTHSRGLKPIKGVGSSPAPLPVMLALVTSETMAKSRAKPRARLRADITASFSPLILDLTWLAPIRTKPRRTYDGFKTDFTPEGDHTPYVIRKTLDSRERAATFTDLLRNFGSSSGLFEKVEAHPFGRDPSAPFEVLVDLSHQPLNISNVGYGVSQVLPVVVEMLTMPKGHWFAIQQPEVHLHPRAQAALGDLMHFLVQTRQHRYIVETHSDYLIDRFRLCMKEKGSAGSAQVLFFERSDGGNKAHILPIGEQGRYPSDQPESFRNFFIKEEIKLLGI